MGDFQNNLTTLARRLKPFLLQQIANSPDSIPGGSDGDAIHDNVSGEINAITEKASPVNADLVIIEDSESSNAKKKVQVGNLPAASGGSEDYINIQDQKTSGTNGGGSTTGSWETRDLNTEVSDAGGHASLSSNQVTLAAGTYRCFITCPAFDVSWHQARLQNVSDGTTAVLGSNAHTGGATEDVQTLSTIRGRFTIASSKTFEVQHRTQVTKPTNGFGVSNNWGTQVYTVAEFWKEN